MKTLVPDALLRAVLWITAVLNLAVGAVVVDPHSALGQLAGLPQEPVPAVYRAMLAAMIGLFGGAYAWLARMQIIDRPLLSVAAIGKTLAFATVFLLWTQGAAGGRFCALMVGDLVFAAIFWAWLRGPAPEMAARP